MSGAKATMYNLCSVNVVQHEIFGHAAVHSSWRRNTRPVQCAVCGEMRQPGHAVKTWCKEHNHVEWIGCDPEPFAAPEREEAPPPAGAEGGAS